MNPHAQTAASAREEIKSRCVAGLQSTMLIPDANLVVSLKLVQKSTYGHV